MIARISDDIVLRVLNYLCPSDIVSFSKTCNFIRAQPRDECVRNMSCFRVTSVWGAFNRHVIDQNDHYDEQDLLQEKVAPKMFRVDVSIPAVIQIDHVRPGGRHYYVLDPSTPVPTIPSRFIQQEPERNKVRY